MSNKTYKYRPDKKFFKQGAYLTDEEGKTVYEAKMTKFSLFGAYQFLFVNNITNKEVEHKVGHTVTSQTTTNGVEDIFSTKSAFKFDGKNIWDYLHEEGIRINTHKSSGKLGFDYDITLKGKDFAEVKSCGKIIGNHVEFDLVTSEDNLDLAFLVTFAIARTEQVFLD